MSIKDLVFDPPPLCERPGCCDLSCVWPGERDPLTWQGDDS